MTEKEKDDDTMSRRFICLSTPTLDQQESAVTRTLVKLVHPVTGVKSGKKNNWSSSRYSLIRKISREERVSEREERARKKQGNRK